MSNPFPETTDRTFAHRVEGTWGEFATVGGRVSYVMTNARLGAGGTDWERRLTSRLRPVREVLDVPDMNFDQLLQRDLDDHRVATELIPYLLRDTHGPVFFPAVLAVLLPFEVGEASTFPAGSGEELVEDDGMRFQQMTFGDAFRSRRLALSNGEVSPFKFGTLAWNEEHARIVVIDGQHRAMALLGLDRTLNNSWNDDARGARYRHFYEERVRHMVDNRDLASIAKLQVPVTVCWFPELVGPDAEPHLAARALFVDVNREAKPPSPDRVVLLSDDDLLNILTRSVLNTVREEPGHLPLHAIEYDNPGIGARHSRWSTISSLQAVKNMVSRAVFGPKKYATNVSTRVRGRESDTERDQFMRRQLRVTNLFPQVLDDGTQREELGAASFPRSAIEPLRDEFTSGWAQALIHILSALEPMRAHHDALTRLADEWQPADPSTVDALAREAVFEGVGMYWTLRESHDHWRSATPAADRSNPPDVVQAWQRLQEKGKEFVRLRAQIYTQSSEPELEDVEAFYEVIETHACQVGLVLLLTVLADRANISGPELDPFAVSVVQALNAGLRTPTNDNVDRRLFLSQTAPNAINRIADMNTHRSVEFRYLWLELLCTRAAQTALLSTVEHLDAETVELLRDKARARYMQQLIDERVAERRRTDRSRSREDLLTPVTSEVIAAMQSSLAYWFDIPNEAFQVWATSADFTVGGDADDDGVDDPDA